MDVLFDYEEVIDNPVICYILEQACKNLKVYYEYEIVNPAMNIHFKIKTRDVHLLEQVFINADKEYRVDPNPFLLIKWLVLMKRTRAELLFNS